MQKFIACFVEVVDAEQDKSRQDLRERLLIALCTTLTGGKDCLDTGAIWRVRGYLSAVVPAFTGRHREPRNLQLDVPTS